jgi:hypothetical protein
MKNISILADRNRSSKTAFCRSKFSEKEGDESSSRKWSDGSKGTNLEDYEEQNEESNREKCA